MSLLKITKVLDAGEKCWGVELLDETGATLLKSQRGARKDEITSIAKVLQGNGKFFVGDTTIRPRESARS